MNIRRGLFRLWILFSVLWILTCAVAVASAWRWFEASHIYKVTDPNKEEYLVEAPPWVPEIEIIEFAKTTLGDKWQRPECSKEKRGPWCEIPVKMKMPREYFSWSIFGLLFGVPAFLFAFGAAIYWSLAGFKASPP